jgi:hypothetical protein
MAVASSLARKRGVTIIAGAAVHFIELVKTNTPQGTDIYPRGNCAVPARGCKQVHGWFFIFLLPYAR